MKWMHLHSIKCSSWTQTESNLVDDHPWCVEASNFPLKTLKPLVLLVLMNWIIWHWKWLSSGKWWYSVSRVKGMASDGNAVELRFWSWPLATEGANGAWVRHSWINMENLPFDLVQPSVSKWNWIEFVLSDRTHTPLANKGENICTSAQMTHMFKREHKKNEQRVEFIQLKIQADAQSRMWLPCSSFTAWICKLYNVYIE